MTLRSCYPTSKRAAETLCVAYSHQFHIEAVVARPCHTYGPHFTDNDTRAYAQFVRNARNHEDIVLKSRGEQYRSWLYVKAHIGGGKVVFDLPSDVERQGFSVIRKAVFDTSKLEALEWIPQYKLQEALVETIKG